LGINDLSETRANGKKATQPCPCGYAGDRSGRCHCTADQVQRYRGRLSGPLLDRIDLHVEVARPDRMPGSVPGSGSGPAPECSALVRRRVVAAREVQLARAGLPNAQLDGAQLREHCRLDALSRRFLEEAAQRVGLSPRACQRILKVARTLADLEGETAIGGDHLAEALAYRGVDHRDSQG
jgi:magnesium chelatase family protein